MKGEWDVSASVVSNASIGFVNLVKVRPVFPQNLHSSPKKCPHRLLRLGRELLQELCGVQASHLEQYLGRANDSGGCLALQGLGLQRLSDEDEHLRCLRDNCRVLSGRVSLVSRRGKQGTY